LNGDAYRIVFFVSALLILGTLYCLLQVDFKDSKGSRIQAFQGSSETT
jgi:hypothetical protein